MLHFRFEAALYMQAVQHFGPAKAGLCVHLAPMFGVVLSTLFLGEHLHLYHALGIAAIVAGLVCFDGGALRAQLEGRYADLDFAVANYNETLVNALTDVATQLSDIRAVDAQIDNAVRSDTAAQRALTLALAQYKAGLTTQLTVLNAQTNALRSSQVVANLRMNRRDRQIALAAALGGGFTDASESTTKAALVR